jgi:hypothetical protein
MAAYATRGYRICYDGSLQGDLEKVALWGKKQGEAVIPTHAALQLV